MIHLSQNFQPHLSSTMTLKKFFVNLNNGYKLNMLDNIKLSNDLEKKIKISKFCNGIF